MKKYFYIFLFWFILASADFLITFANVFLDASNEANPLVSYIIVDYGKMGFFLSGLIYAGIFGLLLLIMRLPTKPKYEFEKKHFKTIIKFRKVMVITALSLVVFAGASHFSGLLTWLYGHYSLLSWFDFVRLTALSAPTAFVLGIYFGRK